MNVKAYLDSTYLKTPQQSGLSENETWEKVKELTQEAIENGFYAVMIRPDYVDEVRKLLDDAKSDVVLGTVIGFHEGTYSTQEKLSEAKKAIEDGADELDFVINYSAFINGNVHGVADEVKACNELALSHGKVIKWIIEAAALSDAQIESITHLIRTITEENFPGKEEMVFVKSSTGFYKTPDGTPNGATEHNIRLMLANAGKLPVKAAGGVRSYEDAVNMINLGVKRIGTSSALVIANGGKADSGY